MTSLTSSSSSSSSSKDVKQGTKEWFALRQNRITASIFGEAIGISPYVSPRSLWQKLTGKVDLSNIDTSSKATDHGIMNEDIARKVYERIMNVNVLETGFYIHPKYSWLGASPDGLINKNGLLEIKCPLYKIHDKIPAHYLAQIQGQLECAEKDYCDFFSYHASTTEYKIFRVYRSKEYWNWLYKYLKDFYVCVQCDIDPISCGKISIPPAILPPECNIEILLHNALNYNVKIKSSSTENNNNNNNNEKIKKKKTPYRPQYKNSLSKKQYRSLISRSNIIKLHHEMKKKKKEEN